MPRENLKNEKEKSVSLPKKLGEKAKRKMF